MEVSELTLFDKDFLSYWEKISNRESDMHMEHELPVFIKLVGLRNLFKIVIEYYKEPQQ